MYSEQKRIVDIRLLTLLELPPGTMLTRSEITRSVIKYSRENGLLIGQYTYPNAALIELFNLQNQNIDRYGLVALQDYLQPLYH
jgi:hypothetical protein